MISRTNRPKIFLSTSPISKRTAVLARPWASDPDELRQVVQEAVSSISEEQRAAYIRRLLSTLGELGLNVPALLFTSGVVEQEPADLTPAEIAHLIRHVRINVPWALLDSRNLFEGLEHSKQTRRAA